MLVSKYLLTIVQNTCLSPTAVTVHVLYKDSQVLDLDSSLIRTSRFSLTVFPERVNFTKQHT